MLILVDTSGSVKGQTLELLVFAVKSLLDTLDDNDYVQVARFPPQEEAKDDSLGIVGCFRDFVQVSPNFRQT